MLALEDKKENEYQDDADDQIPTEIDPSEAVVSDSHIATMEQYVAWSATYQLPTFYFTMHDASGTPIPLEDIYQSAFFQKSRPMIAPPETTGIPAMFDRTQRDQSRLGGGDNAQFPVLAQGDHPVLGTPCWVFHPCETSTAIREILDELVGDGWTGSEDDLVRWLETWFMVLSSVVDLRM
ncbi:hypothetical protein FRC00_000451 [Tulasnella sp. 408]|nr:hypothetical protein FRC00_000451 [Tulasnella sp. 408]